jgi:hypothetical protein
MRLRRERLHERMIDSEGVANVSGLKLETGTAPGVGLDPIKMKFVPCPSQAIQAIDSIKRFWDDEVYAATHPPPGTKQPSSVRSRGVRRSR